VEGYFDQMTIQQVICDACGHVFNIIIKRNKKGAGYALDWDILKPYDLEFLSWWLSNYPYQQLSKDELREKYHNATVASLPARISECYAFDLLIRHKTKLRYPKVRYSLNLSKVIKVLNAGGRLDALKD